MPEGSSALSLRSCPHAPPEYDQSAFWAPAMVASRTTKGDKTIQRGYNTTPQDTITH